MDNNNVQAGLANINAKAEVNTEIKGELKAADNIHTQFGGTYNDNRTIIVQGVTREEMNACLDLKIHEKIESFKKELESDILPNKLEKLKSDVGVITSYKEAISISAIKNDEDFDKVLSSVLKERIESDDTDTQSTCSLAISTMKNLTKNHLKLNALFYLFRSGYLKEFSSAQEFINFYDKYLVRLIDIPHDKLRDIGTAIIGNGCAVTYTFGSNVSDFFDNQIVEYIAKLATKENISDEEENQKNIIDKLNNIWFQTGLTSAFPTAIGKCLGKTYLHDVLGLDIIEKIKSESNNRIVTHGDLSQIYKYE